LATDLGMGFPFEHGLHTTLIAMRLADRLGVDRETASQTYYACLLSHAGCTTDAHVAAEIFRGSLTAHFNPVMFASRGAAALGLMRAMPEPGRAAPVRAAQVARALPRLVREQRLEIAASCEVAQMLAGGLGVPSLTAGLLAYVTERWDGRGPLRRARGEQIPLPIRIVSVAMDAALQRVLFGPAGSARLVRERAGKAFDPEVSTCLADHADEILAPVAQESAWPEVLAREPPPALVLAGAQIDRALAAMGSFADLISPFLAGHAAGVADLAEATARRCGIDSEGATMLRRAGLVHDLGRVAISPRVWQKQGFLTADEREQVRLHVYHTERVLARSPFLSLVCRVAGAHHERLDGSGYHRGAVGAELTLPARVLGAADAYHAMTEPRAHRRAMTPVDAAAELAREVHAGRFDADVVTAIIEVAGQRVPRLERPAGLTAREVEVVAMLARGLQTKQVARALGISVKTADRHIQNAYRKAGVSSRAGATLFAMEHGLVAWGEFPMAHPAGRS
jgi:HD-GYP domain-containing protein (c-di-GMP phosphodiesterase class II)